MGGPVNFDETLNVIGASSFLSLVSIRLSTNAPSLETRVTGDAEPLFSILRDGSMSWGSGGASPTDVSFFRSAAGTLRTDGSLTVDNTLLVSVDATVQGVFTANGNSFFGNATSDLVSFTARIDSSFIPSTSTTYDLGSVLLPWRDLFVGGNAVFGTTSSDSVSFNSYISSNFIPSLDNSFSLGLLPSRWLSLFLSSSLRNDGNTILGTTASDSLTLNASVNSHVLPFADDSFSLGSNSARWRNLFLAGDLSVDGDSVLGDSSSDTIAFIARASTDFVPSVDDLYSLGTISLRWSSLYSSSIFNSGNLEVSGDTILGDATSDTVTFNARISSDMIPSADNTYDIGSPALRWKTLHVGPGSVVVHNDTIDSNKISLAFSGATSVLNSDGLSPMNISVGGTLGLFLDILGNVGVNRTTGISYRLDVDGTAGFSDTVYANRSSGISLYVESDLVVNGSIEAPALSTILNIGASADTHFVNIGTGAGLQTINIGTGSGPTAINIGGAGDIITFGGTASFSQTINSAVLDKTFTLNAGGASLSGADSGILIEEASAVLLASDTAVWQSGNVVRYTMIDTGDIMAGSSVVIVSFANPSNNGQFTVQSVSADTYIDVISTRSNATDDELAATGSVTDPQTVASFTVNSARDGWEFRSPVSYSNLFSFVNSGANSSFDSSPSGLVLDPANGVLLPSVSGQDLGSVTERWDVFADNLDANSVQFVDLTVTGNTILGDAGTDTVTVNASISFLGGLDTGITPNSALLDIGSSVDRWRDLWLSGSADIEGSLVVDVNATVGLDLTVNGNTTLGDAATDSITFTARADSSFLPITDLTYNLGSSGLKWNNVFTGSLSVSTLTTGSVVYAGSGGLLSQSNSEFFWDSANNRLGLGTNTPSRRFDIHEASTSPAARLLRVDTSHGLGFFADNASRIQYTGSLTFSVVTATNLATSAAGVDSIQLSASGLASVLSAFGYNPGSAVAANTYAVASTDTLISVDTTSVSITADCTITLPSAAVKRLLIVKDTGNNCSSINKHILLTPASGEFVEFGVADEAFIMDSDGMSLTLHSDGVSRWFII